MDNKFTELPYTHREIITLLDKIATEFTLKPEQYKQLIDEIGLDNISTFSGDYEDLDNTPDIPQYVADLKDGDNVVMKLDLQMKINSIQDNIEKAVADMMSSVEDGYMTQNYVNTALSNLEYALRQYINDYVIQHTSGAASRADLTKTKSDLLSEINKKVSNEMYIRDMAEKANVLHNHDYDKLFAAKATEHVHDNNEVLDALSQAQIDFWEEKIEEHNESIAVINDKLDNLDRDDLIETWKTLHSGYVFNEEGEAIKEVGLGHSNLSVLNKIDDISLTTWDGIKELKFKTEKPPITTQTVGGLDKGTNITDFSIHMLLERILLPDIKPEASMKINNTPSGSVFEKGTATSVTTITASITIGSNPIKIVNLIRDGVVIQSKVPTETEGIVTLTFDVNQVLESSIPAGYYRVVVEDNKGYKVEVKSSAINFYHPCYYGTVNKEITANVITEAQIKALTKRTEAKGNKTFAYTTDNQRMAFAYPAEFGNLSSIQDQNGFEIIGSFEKATVNVVAADGNTVSYYVYINNANSNTNFKITYKF